VSGWGSTPASSEMIDECEPVSSEPSADSVVAAEPMSEVRQAGRSAGDVPGDDPDGDSERCGEGVKALSWCLGENASRRLFELPLAFMLAGLSGFAADYAELAMATRHR